jgi:post-segregation antitoxin (ccd killing protein)
MPKVSVYLPDQLYDDVRAHNIPVSAVTQDALTEALRRDANTQWIAKVRARAPRITATIDTSALIDDARGEFET